MARTVQVGRLRLGQGRPAVCVPLCAEDRAGLDRELDALQALRPDLVEWRADHCDATAQDGGVEAALDHLRSRLGEIPLLLTLRAPREGGAGALDDAARGAVYRRALAHGGCDLIDLELACDAAVREEVVAAARHAAVPVILSHHNFSGTPEMDAMFETLAAQRQAGADIAKLAVTPNTPEDLLALLAVTQRAHRELDVALITVSMGRLGMLSRVGGGVFGSVLSYGSGLQPTAPGQVDARTLRGVLELLHPNG